jgi:hypothetical protein
MSTQDVIQAFLDEINKDNWTASDFSWVFVTNLNGVDIYHKTYDKHIGILGEAFLPDVQPSQLYSLLLPALSCLSCLRVTSHLFDTINFRFFEKGGKQGQLR